MPEFRNDVFVEYCVTAARIKAYFGSLLTKKNKLYRHCDVLPPEAAGGTSKTTYQNCRKKADLLLLIRQRNIQTQGALHRKSVAELVKLLTADDEELAHAENNDLDQDEAHAAVECASGDLNPVGGSLES